MISNNGKHYLYRHIRTDNGQPFYIGIGTKSNVIKSFITEYSRANTKKNRNAHWINIVNKTTYEIEILFESDNYDFIKEKEKEFINLYGRIGYNNYGILCNKTIGGDGTKGVKHTDETRAKQSERLKKIGFPKAFVEAREHYRKGREFPKEVLEKREKTRKENAEKRGYYVHPDSHKHEQIKVDQYTKEGIFVKTWEGIRVAAKALNVPHNNISTVCKKKGRLKTVGGYKWEYHNKNTIT
jgi:hypothetical protein